MSRRAEGARPRFALYGLGAIGKATARAIVADGRADLVAVVDNDPAKVGRDLPALLRLRSAPPVAVSAGAEALAAAGADVVIHCTGSRLADVAPQLEAIARLGVACVSSCEEMALPEDADPELAARLDRTARDHSVALVGAGVNPGFVMDALVVTLSGATRRVSHVHVERVLDPMSRRPAFRRKVGLGMNYREATAAAAAGAIGHVGLRQSALLIAKALGFTPGAIEEELEVLCGGDLQERRAKRPQPPDEPVSGLRQSLVLKDGAREVIRMDMVMNAGAEAPHDAITIQGEPPLSLWMQGGIHGDDATVACLINTARLLVERPAAGLLTLLDLPPRPAWRI